MTIKLYNTKVRKKVDFEPIDAEDVRMYVCGPTVYDRAHLGNARPVIVFDTLYRLLRHTTDVDDKINATALSRQQAGAKGSLEDLITERSNETIAWYLEDMTAVGAMEPNAAPRATQYIDQMITMIQDLIDKGHAYAAEGHALFRVRSYENYGALSGRSVDDMIAGARVEVAPFKEDAMDFVLWKPFAKVWMHNEMLQVEGKKMSKSLGNFFTVRDLLNDGVQGEVIRFVMLSTHYRKPMDWTEKKRLEAEKTLRKWYTQSAGSPDTEVPSEIVQALSDDLNTAGALAELHKLSNAGKDAELRAALTFLGLLGDAVPDWATETGPDLSAYEAHFDAIRADAMATKDFSKVDAIKSALVAAGVEVRMSKEGVQLEPTPTFDATKLEGVL